MAKAKAGSKLPEKNDGPMCVRFRRATTIDKKTYQPQQVETLPQSDELWEAVNVGDADLTPAPGEPLGEGTQPFPPEWVAADENSEAADPTATTVPAEGRTLPGRPSTMPADDLDEKTVAELHDIARKEGVEGASGLNKDDLVKVIKKSRRK